MPAPLPLWSARIPRAVEARLERMEAAAREALVETHAALACDLVGVLSPRMPFDDAVDRYLEIMGLGGDDAEAVGTRAVARLGFRTGAAAARDGRRSRGFNWRYVTPVGAYRLLRSQKKRSDEEHLWLELSAARAEERLVRAHARFALRFVELLDGVADPPRAVALYLQRMEVDELRARIVYQRVVARLANALLPRLEADPPEG